MSQIQWRVCGSLNVTPGYSVPDDTPWSADPDNVKAAYARLMGDEKYSDVFVQQHEVSDPVTVGIKEVV